MTSRTPTRPTRPAPTPTAADEIIGRAPAAQSSVDFGDTLVREIAPRPDIVAIRDDATVATCWRCSASSYSAVSGLGRTWTHRRSS
jgi:hypothetical protein